MKQIISIIIITGVTLGMIACKKEDPDKTVRIYSLVGDVKVVASQKEKAASIGDVLLAGDSIRTGADSIVDILFGTAGIIRIHPDTNISVTTLMDEVTGDTRLDMAAGKMNVTLAKLSKGEFRVQTPVAVASVRGTTFRITAEEKAMRLDVVTGAVRISPVRNNTVVADAGKTVEMNQTVKLDEKTVNKVVEKKAEIIVAELKPGEVTQIKDEIRGIKPGMIEKLNKDAQEEIREKVLAPDDSAAREKEEKEKKDRETKELAAKILREQTQRQKEAKKLMESGTKTKQKESGEGDSKNTPPSLQSL